MNRYLLILLTLTILTGVGYSQVPIKRKKTEKTEQTQSPSSRQTQQQTSNNKKKVQSSVKVSEPDGYINGHGYVDLGLPSGTKWATCNIGASTPSDYGDYYAWGEKDTKSSYLESNSLNYGKTEKELRSANIITTENILDMSYDVARKKWGGRWRIPTNNDCVELIKKCEWVWVKYNNKNGFKVVGPNGKSIFLPTAGWREGRRCYKYDWYGGFWTSTFNGSPGYYGSNWIENGWAYKMVFNAQSDKGNTTDETRNTGLSVRPVLE
ncbi:MAG: hypothetical protein HDS16_08860 [Bacteroides sp.]|nr:hypothetical protein [Bacteroides sp.]